MTEGRDGAASRAASNRIIQLSRIPLPFPKQRRDDAKPRCYDLLSIGRRLRFQRGYGHPGVIPYPTVMANRGDRKELGWQ